VSEITLEQARSIISAAFDIAHQRSVVRATIVVTDVAGAIKALERNNASGPFGADFVLAKARTALGMRSSTLELAAGFLDRPSVVTGINAAVAGDFLPMGGGVLIVSGTGTLLGAAAFSGAPHEVDHEIMVAAVEAAGLRTKI
jgi:uncharacterized protein GlcG (DUF336 family)